MTQAVVVAAVKHAASDAAKILLATNQMHASEARSRHPRSVGVTAIVAVGSRIPAGEIRPSHRALSGVIHY